MLALAWVAAFALWCQFRFLLGLRIFLRVLAICWRVLWAPILLFLCFIGVCLLVFDAEAAALQVAQEPDVGTGGSRIEDRLSTVSSSRCWVFNWSF